MITPTKPSLIKRIFNIAKSVTLTVVALAVLGLFMAWMGGMFHEKIPPEQKELEKEKVGNRKVIEAKQEGKQNYLPVVGTIQPSRKTEISSQLLAVIREVKPRVGDRIKEGELVIILDDRELIAQQREALAALSSAEADLVGRKANYDRVAEGPRASGISADEFTRIETAYRVTEALVKRSKETVNRIEVQLSYAKILAPGSGVVAERLVEPGYLASPGRPLLTIYDPNDLELHIYVPESIAWTLSVGKSIPVKIESNDWESNLVVKEIAPQALPNSRSVLMKLSIPSSAGINLKPGMFGRAMIPLNETAPIVVPIEAIRQQGQLEMVDVVDDQGYLNRRFVRIGKIENGQAEILSGLKAGEKIALLNK